MLPSVARLIFTLLIVSISTQASPLSAQENPAAQQIRKLITQAAAMRRADFDRIARSTSTPKPGEFADQSLTLLLFAFTNSDDKKSEQFQLLSKNLPRPAELARVVNRGFGKGPLFIPIAPVSLIHQDYITDVTCEVKGETATGVISFKAPYVYAGKVSYIAQKTPTRWHITDLMMSDLDLHLVRGNGGLWKEKE